MVAKVTMELRELIERGFKLFDFEYRFDDEEFKKELEQHVIDHYYYYEIAFSPTKFKHKFKTKWLSMIGYYNDLHNTTKYHYNPLINRRYYEERTKEVKEENTAHTTTDERAKSEEESSNYPQASFGEGDYRDSASKANSERDQEQNATAESNQKEKQENWYEAMEGTTYQDLIRKERENLMRLKTTIAEELKPLFILVY